MRPLSFSYQRKAGMSALDPSRMPAWDAPVCEDQPVVHGVSAWLPSATHLAMVGALPSRMARCRTGCAETVDLHEDHPGGRSSSAACARGPPIRTARLSQLPQDDVVVVEREQCRQRHGDRRHDRRDGEAPPEVVEA